MTEEQKKIKVLTISDHPLTHSGVGTQSKYFIEALLKADKFQVISMGGALKHQNYQPMKTEEWGDDWIIYPVDGYGNADIIRSLVRTHKPDILWFMTDPRFFYWLWEIEDEIRPLVPFFYHHIWDNVPYPNFNKPLYESTDVISCISKVTHDIVQNVAPDVESFHMPHSVDGNIFKKLPTGEVEAFRDANLPQTKGKTVFLFNSRNARRKMSGSIVWWFKEFLDKVGKDKACLLMHTDPKDQHGQDLHAIVQELGLINGEVLFSAEKMSAEALALFYNVADATVQISDAEGWGLSVTESMSCETPVIATMTGGLQEQVTDGKEFFGVGIEPASKAVIGSQDVPYIYEDRVAKEDVVAAFEKIHNLSQEEKDELGKKCRAHVDKNYKHEAMMKKWPEILERVHKERGSWDTRKNYKSWDLGEIK